MSGSKFYDLPFHIQLALGGGYTAYIIAYSGIRDHHKAVDVAFRSTAFGLIVILALSILPEKRPVFSGILSFCTAVGGGVLWRVVGVAGIPRLMRLLNISWSDDSPSAWAKMQGDSKFKVTQIAVQLENDVWLMCDDANRFSNEPFGPCLFGTNGDIAIYVTSETGEPSDNDDTKESKDNKRDEALQDDVVVAGWGSQLTWIPSTKVKRLVVRRKSEPSFLQNLMSIFRGRGPARSR